jgi:hypothetical protein
VIHLNHKIRRKIMMKSLLTLLVSVALIEQALASATVVLEAENDRAELQAMNPLTSTGFIGHGGKYLWKVKYVAEPGTYTLRGTTPGCPPVVESASFEEGQSYHMTLTEDCRIESVSL